MNFEKKFLTKYLDTIIELSQETGMSKKESRTMLDISLSNQNPKTVDFNEIKTEIIFKYVSIHSVVQCTCFQ